MVGLQGINVKEEEGSEHAKEWEGTWTGDEGGEGDQRSEGRVGRDETTTRGTVTEKEEWEIDWTWRRQ